MCRYTMPSVSTLRASSTHTEVCVFPRDNEETELRLEHLFHPSPRGEPPRRGPRAEARRRMMATCSWRDPCCERFPERLPDRASSIGRNSQRLMPTLIPTALHKGGPISSRTGTSLLLSCVHWTRYTVQAPCPAARLSEGEPAKSRDRDASVRVWDRSPLPGRAAPRRDQLAKIPFPEPPLTRDGADTPSSRRFSTDESVPCAAVASSSHGLSSMGLVPLQGL